jgi:hypothetical protein
MDSSVIDHQQAVDNLMAERYLLGELGQQELDAFEGHLFDCSACFEQVKAGTEFVRCVKRIGAEEPVVPAPQPRWRHLLSQALRPAPAFAFAALFLISTSFNIYQNARIRQMRAPQTVAVETLHPESRQIVKTITASRHGYFEVRLVFQPKDGTTSYKAQVVNQAGKEITSIPIKNVPGNSLQLRFNSETFTSGTYKIVLLTEDQTPGSSTVLDQYPFALQLQD